MMTTHLENAVAGVATGASALLGSTLLPLLADVTPIPEWMGWFLGPFGALVGMIFAMRWLTGRLDKAEVKADRRDDERDADRKHLITVLEQSSTALQNNTIALQTNTSTLQMNSNVLGEFKEVMKDLTKK
jgi:hypothetical protein